MFWVQHIQTFPFNTPSVWLQRIRMFIFNTHNFWCSTLSYPLYKLSLMWQSVTHWPIHVQHFKRLHYIKLVLVTNTDSRWSHWAEILTVTLERLKVTINKITKCRVQILTLSWIFILFTVSTICYVYDDSEFFSTGELFINKTT